MGRDGIVAFLHACLAELEEAANWASTAPAARDWRLLSRDTVEYGEGLAIDCGGRAAAHVALHDPTYVLADIAAKRAIIEKAQKWIATDNGAPHQRALALAGQDLLELLAAPFADRPGYNETWRP